MGDVQTIVISYGVTFLFVSLAIFVLRLRRLLMQIEENHNRLLMACDHETRDRYRRVVVDRKNHTMTLNWQGPPL